MVIVVSILLAFGIDAWWTEMREAEEGQRALSGLIQDGRSNLEALDGVIDGHARVVRMLHAMETQEPRALEALPADSVREYAGFAMAWWGTFNGQTGTLDRLIASGSFDLIRDEALKTRLVEWQAALLDAQEEGEEALAQTMRIIDHLSVLGGPWTTIDLAGRRPGWGPEFSLFPPVDLVELTSDTELMALLRHRHLLSLAYLWELLPLRDQTQELLVALEAKGER
jgi:hypothetical protein